MMKFSAELEDVVFTAIRSNEDGNWTVELSESEQAQKDFRRKERRTLVLNDGEMQALLFLAYNVDGMTEAVRSLITLPFLFAFNHVEIHR
jgi:hypothetical protein